VFTYVPGSNRIATVSDIFIAPDGSIVTGDPPVPDYVSSFTHDGAGNIKKWDFPATLTASYTYDGFNRMNAVLDTTSGSVTLGQYGYNAFGERTSKRDLTHAHDYAFIYGEGHELLADRENGAWTNYVWFAGELVGMTRAGVLYQIDNDHLGRPETITNANKAVVWQSNNDPFGGMHPTTNTLGEFNIGLPGQYFDAESNYWYNVNRYYVPAIGRYLQADPVGLGGGLNPYAYVGGNPANSTDPTGLGPVAFGLCTAANFAYQGYSIYSSLRADGVSEIQDRLQSVNKEIDDCPLDDFDRLDQLTSERQQLQDQLGSIGQQYGSRNSNYTLNDITGGLIWELACTALFVAPTP
jgi:RHS repeat-associated protein